MRMANNVNLYKVLADADTQVIDAFGKYHKANPVVWEHFKKFAMEIRATKRKRYSAWTIINRIRWEHDIGVHSEDFKINNNYIAFYARILIHTNPEFKDFFELRALKKPREVE